MKRYGLVLLVLLLTMWGCLMAGFVTIAPNGRYFQHDGTLLVPLGFNDAISWPSLAPVVSGDDKGARRYFEEISRSGVNVLRVMFEYAQDRSNVFLMEDPLGQRNDLLLESWDRILELAEEFGMYLIITPWDPFWAYENWDVNPYNRKNGGPIDSFREFLTDPGAIENARQRFSLLVERYGHSENVLAWELNNEIELWYGKIFRTPDATVAREVQQWVQTMSAFIRQRERELYGQAHLVTVSTASPALQGTLARALYNNPSLDFVTTHFYLDGIKKYSDPKTVSEEVVMTIAYHQYVLQTSQPFMDSESGPIDQWPKSAAHDRACFKSFSWSHLASGGTGIGMRWPYTIPHRMPSYLLSVIHGVHAFLEAGGINWLHFGALENSQSMQVEADQPVFFAYSVDTFSENQWAMGWLSSENGKAIQRATLGMEGFAAGEFVLEAWDTDAGVVLAHWLGRSEGEWLTFQVEGLPADFAFKVYPRGEKHGE
ncbi:MAG TPA: cellulase family glycosylhydrolase [Thermotogota bacterium]|nr:cellulase family glycosylhydrolase [Thermotogota bacterium]